MGSICLAKQQNFASLNQSNLEVAEEQAISDQMSTMSCNLSCNFISTLELQFKSSLQQNHIEQQQPIKMGSDLSQLTQQTMKKGILKNKNNNYEYELKMLTKTIKLDNEGMHCEKLVNYLKARKYQDLQEIHL
ncbi:unnamed protein product (macronuclear) [Paramecium tetraurelia]|uniref:Uncharacterized protein n=1 Tax=Paramecium tetraurelia TaxID=5888 RepID=A0DMH9_PARTE|nr:uncharacterized protein GSPATT00018464001 [Paramecium tetraurelia]CAK84246.1 unnamed protein product [Paramecium tetraurelia]|eukprot:XP_001451643.1 hypothetical protein (macronuclear) [Paramecium tetraurelia strain d4-2]